MAGTDGTAQAVNALAQVYRSAAHYKAVAFIQVEHDFFEDKGRNFLKIEEHGGFRMVTAYRTDKKEAVTGGEPPATACFITYFSKRTFLLDYNPRTNVVEGSVINLDIGAPLSTFGIELVVFTVVAPDGNFAISSPCFVVSIQRTAVDID